MLCSCATPEVRRPVQNGSHTSIDDGSLDSSVFLIHPGYHLSEARGSSSFDVRQVLTLALSYRIPRRTFMGALPDALAALIMLAARTWSQARSSGLRTRRWLDTAG